MSSHVPCECAHLRFRSRARSDGSSFYTWMGDLIVEDEHGNTAAVFLSDKVAHSLCNSCSEFATGGVEAGIAWRHGTRRAFGDVTLTHSAQDVDAKRAAFNRFWNRFMRLTISVKEGTNRMFATLADTELDLRSHTGSAGTGGGRPAGPDKATGKRDRKAESGSSTKHKSKRTKVVVLTDDDAEEDSVSNTDE